MSYIKTLAADKNVITFRPELKRVIKNTNATILLQQIMYWWDKQGGKPFYKFIEPCGHEKYTEGDSWSEELCFTKREFQGAFEILKELGLVSSKPNISRITYYTLNVEKLEAILDEIYGDKEAKNSTCVSKHENVRRKGTIPCADYSKNCNSAETTTESNNIASSSSPNPQQTSVTDGEFQAAYADLRMCAGKYLGAKEQSYESYRQIKEYLNIGIVAYAYKKYKQELNTDERLVGLSKFIDNMMFLSYLPDRVAVRNQGVRLEGVKTGESFSTSAMSTPMTFPNATFLRMLMQGNVEFLDFVRV